VAVNIKTGRRKITYKNKGMDEVLAISKLKLYTSFLKKAL